MSNIIENTDNNSTSNYNNNTRQHNTLLPDLLALPDAEDENKNYIDDMVDVVSRFERLRTKNLNANLQVLAMLCKDTDFKKSIAAHIQNHWHLAQNLQLEASVDEILEILTIFC